MSCISRAALRGISLASSSRRTVVKDIPVCCRAWSVSNSWASSCFLKCAVSLTLMESSRCTSSVARAQSIRDVSTRFMLSSICRRASSCRAAASASMPKLLVCSSPSASRRANVFAVRGCPSGRFFAGTSSSEDSSCRFKVRPSMPPAPESSGVASSPETFPLLADSGGNLRSCPSAKESPVLSSWLLVFPGTDLDDDAWPPCWLMRRVRSKRNAWRLRWRSS
mmetsp:Transcript_15793/g.28050  ORF Transcript_15793/g.28050 Transcript_15793/m.28050 type:complete len:223 (-) Transcript_15793:457-1125(-)